jgi:DnaK suppressor protein
MAAKGKTVKKPASAPAKPKATKARLSDDLDFKNFTPYKEKKGETYMNDQQEAHFRAILKGWKKELMEKVDETVLHMKDEAANFPDPNDRASQESEFTMELRTRDRERKLIKKIEEALENLDNHEYGYCDVCGIEIGIRRLEARPMANQCIDCKTLDEIREKQYGK